MKQEEPFHLERVLVVGAVADAAAFKMLAADCDMIELRLDSLGAGEEVINYAKQCPCPLLLTARGPEEGGQNNCSVEERRAAYMALLPYATAIDIELRSFYPLRDVIDAAKKAGVTIVGSFHNFEMTPPLDILTAKIGDIADIHKFATMVNSESDLEIHRALLQGGKPLSVMGMGSLGAEARPEMMKMGSLLNYGYLGEVATAPNQWPVAKLKALAG